VLAFDGGKIGKGGDSRGWVRGQKMELLTLSVGPTKVEVRSHVQGATIPNKRVTNTLKINKWHACREQNKMCFIYKEKYILSPALKINHVMEKRNMRLFLAQWTVWFQLYLSTKQKFFISPGSQ
jgi:hypothetical protein